MLIVPGGRGEWDKRLELATEPDKKKLRREIGYNPSATARPEKLDMPGFTAWQLPKNFCPGCDRTDIIPKRGLDGTLRLNPGIWQLDEPKPEIGLKPGDIIWMWICHDCADQENWGRVNLHGGIQQRTFFNNIQEKRLERATEWIKAEISRGASPTESRGY